MRSLARYYAGPVPCFPGTHGRVFTAGPAPTNPPKRDWVGKRLEQVYQKQCAQSSGLAWEVGFRRTSRAFHPPLGKQGPSRPISVTFCEDNALFNFTSSR